MLKNKIFGRSKRILSLILLIVFAASNLTFAAGFDSQEIKFEKILNARDLGGYKTTDGRTVKKNVLVRSAELAYATKADLNKLKNQYNLKTVIDFRYAPDYKYCKDKRIAGVRYKNIPVKYNKKPSKKAPKKRYKRLKNKSAKKLRSKAIPKFGKVKSSYTKSLVMSSYSQKQYRKYFNELLSNTSGSGVLMHCTYGKDRTGVASFMTLIALGVDEEPAYRDYAMTNSYLKKYGPKTYKKGRIGVREKDLRNAIKAAKKKYGSLDNFLYKAYGLDAAKRAKLKEIYTE